MALISFLPHLPAGDELTAFLVVVCFSAGLNVYATVLVLGLLAHAGVLVLPPGLHALENGYVLGICGVLFAIELVGDKVPVLDLVWNAMHTFVRVPAAAVIAYAGTSTLPEWERLVAMLLGALVALAAHGGKIAARAAVTASPEPFSNIALSLSEDAAVAFLLWYATRHPFFSAAIVLATLAFILLMARVVIGAVRNLLRDGESALARGC